MNKVLVINVNWMGDVIFSTPVFQALKEFYPQSSLTCLAVPRVRDVLELNPYIDHIIVYDEERGHRSVRAKWQLIRQLRKEKFDSVFLLHRSLTRALLVFFAGIPKRVGYDEKKRGVFLTHPIQPPVGWIHRADHYLGVIESFGVNVSNRGYQLSVPQASLNNMDLLLKKHEVSEKDFLVVIHPGGNWDLKRWPQENFAILINALMKNAIAKVVISGGGNERELSEAILAKVEPQPIVLTGDLHLKDLAALLKRADLVISGDSGPLHLASSVGTDVVALFGPTRPEVTGVRGIGRVFALQKDVGCNREPCYNLACSDNICMKAIKHEEVLRTIERLNLT